MARQYCCDRCGGDWAGNARPVFYDNIWAAWGMQPHELLCDTCALNYAGGKYQLSQSGLPMESTVDDAVQAPQKTAARPRHGRRPLKCTCTACPLIFIGRQLDILCLSY